MKKGMIFFTVVLVLGLWITAGGRKESHQIGSMAALSQDALGQISKKPGVDIDFGRMPVYFIANEGQLDDRVAYYVTGKDKKIYFTREGVTFVLAGSDEGEEEALKRWAMKLDFIGADRDVYPEGEEKKEAVISYFKGAPEEWRTGISTYSRVVYKNLWPGIDLVYYGTMDRLKYEFIVHPGADPSKIRLAYRGVSGVEVNEKGCLEVKTPLGGFEDDIPFGYQEVEGKKVEVEMSYVVEEVKREKSELAEDGVETKSFIYSFDLGNYDQTKPLMLDPVILVYCGYIGGSGSDLGKGIAADGSGNAYVTGKTNSTEATFPVTLGPDTTHNGGSDVFVAKVNASGTSVLYCGYIGGSSHDTGNDIAVDSLGNAYITGKAGSSGFPITVGPSCGGAFVAKVSPTGTDLLYCRFLGDRIREGFGIAVDGLENAYVAGGTGYPEARFQTLSDYDIMVPPYTDAFVAKVNASGTTLLYYRVVDGSLGGGGAHDVAVDSLGNAYVTGYKNIYILPPYVVQADAFVAKVNTSGTDLLYHLDIGGENGDHGYGITVDGSGNAYVTGITRSTEATFPVIAGPDTTYNGGADAFVAKVNVSGTALLYCGYIGGSLNDYGNGIAVDSLGNAYVTGYTLSTEATFPVIAGPDTTYNGGADAFVAKVDTSGTAFLYCGYIGGILNDYGNSIAVDSSGNAYVTGDTNSTEATFPVIAGPDTTFNGNEWDAFVAKISVISRYDLLGTWASQGVYYRNSDTGSWVNMATPATQIAAGDIDNDGVDDLLGIWPAQEGVWVKYSSDGSWAKLSNSPDWIGTGDMNGNGRDDYIGSWSVTQYDIPGVYCRDSASGSWVRMATPATQIAAGDIDGDGTDDLLGIWPGQGGVWVKYSSSSLWEQLSSTADWIGAGDMNGDGRDDLVGTWSGQGVYYRDSASGNWVLMATPTTQITAGDISGDGTDDLLGIWHSQGGVWVKYSSDSTWEQLSSTADWIACGKMREAGGGSSGAIALSGPFGGAAEGPDVLKLKGDLLNIGPSGSNFLYKQEQNLMPKRQRNIRIMRIPGPGDPGFTYIKQQNLVPFEDAVKKRGKK